METKSMTIEDVKINNWEAPGEKWWDTVQSKPTEPLIQATIRMTLSWDEYEKLLAQGERNTGSESKPCTPS